MKQKLLKFYSQLEGWKTVIGLALLQVEARVDLPDDWWVQTLVVLLYAWTGYGAFDKVKRMRKNGTPKIRWIYK